MKNPAIHVYLTFAPLMLGGALLVKQEWVYGSILIGISALMIGFAKYYEAIKNNSFLIKSLTIYISICAISGTLEHLKIITFGVSYTIFLITLVYYIFKLKNTVTKLANDKAQDAT